MSKSIKVFSLLLVLTVLSAASDKIPPELLHAREQVWRAWYAHDAASLDRLLTDNLIGINPGEVAWQDRTATLQASQDFVKGGGKLVSVTFPQTRMQRYGNVAVLYSLYELKYESEGQTHQIKGRATEVFVLKNGRWTNPGWHLDSGK